MRGWPLAALMSQCTRGQVVTPGMGRQKCPWECATDTARIIAKVEVPQFSDSHLGYLCGIPAAANPYRFHVVIEGLSGPVGCERATLSLGMNIT